MKKAGKIINGKTPGGGINESMYVEINGTKQWINGIAERVMTQNKIITH